METSSQLARGPHEHGPPTHKWLVAIAVMMGTTLEVLDTSIVNVALRHLQGSFSATVDEISWVLTSYLVANGVMIPMTGWIAARFGRKRYFMFSVLVFVAASALCGAARSLDQMVVFRLLQGAAGAAIGIAYMTNVLVHHQQTHQARLVEHFTIFDAWRMSQTAPRMPGAEPFDYMEEIVTGQKQGIGGIYGMIGAQAAMLSFNDIYRTLAFVMVFLVPSFLLLRRVQQRAGEAPAH